MNASNETHTHALALTNNTLFIYDGGGYDGCFWELNAFLVDKSGNLHNLYKSGRLGIDVATQSTESILSDLNSEYANAYGISLDNETEILEFTSTSNASFVLSIGTKLNTIYSNLYSEAPIVFICPLCGTKESVYEYDTAIGTGISFQGGLVYSAKDIICSECYSLRTCGYCGEFVEDFSDLKNSDECGCDVCEYCYNEKFEGSHIDESENENESDPNVWESEEQKNEAYLKLKEIADRLND